jgi:hypothetical protein
MSHFITYLTLAATAEVTADRIAAEYQRLYGETIEVTQAASASQAGTALVAIVDRMPVTMMLIGKPLPGDAYEAALQADQFGVWPEARQVLSANKAHLIVALLGDPKEYAPNLKGAALVTKLAGALANLLPVTAAIWTEAQAAVKPEQIRSLAAELHAGGTPVPLWTTMAFYRGERDAAGKDTVGVASRGLLPFIGREIEFVPVALPPLEIGRRAAGLLQYLIANGPVIEDGDAAGLTKDEAIRAHYKPAGKRPGIPVIELTLERLDPEAPQTTFSGRNQRGA